MSENIEQENKQENEKLKKKKKSLFERVFLYIFPPSLLVLLSPWEKMRDSLRGFLPDFSEFSFARILVWVFIIIAFFIFVSRSSFLLARRKFYSLGDSLWKMLEEYLTPLGLYVVIELSATALVLLFIVHNAIWGIFTVLLSLSLGSLLMIVRIPSIQLLKDMRMHWVSSQGQRPDVNEYREVVIKVCGGVIFLVTVIVTIWNYRETSKVTAGTQIASNIQNGVKMLASGDNTKMMGGIYILDRIATDYPDEGWNTISSIFNKYVIQNTLPKSATDDVDISSRPHINIIVNLMSHPDKHRHYNMVMRRANLNSLFRRRGNFAGADMRHATITNADLMNSDFSNAKLFEVNFWKARLHCVDFTEANMNRVNLTGAAIPGADFRGASLWNATIVNTRDDIIDGKKQFTSFADAHLLKAVISGGTFDRVNFRSAKLMDATISDATFIGSNFASADLRGTAISDATFIGVILDGVDFSKSIMDRTAFSDDIDFSKVKSFGGARINDASITRRQRDDAIAKGAINETPYNESSFFHKILPTY